KNVQGKVARGRSFFLRKVARGKEVNEQSQQSPNNDQAEAQMKRKPLLNGLIVYILATFSIGILVYMYKASEKRPNLLVGVAELFSTTQANVGGPNMAISMRAEVLRYYLEIVSPSNKTGDGVTRTTGLMPLDGGTKFKFHFKVTEGGYLYI